MEGAPSPTRASVGHPGAPADQRSAARRLLVPPARWSALSGWALLPLRAFLGVTFVFAGLQKLANPNFFDANSPSGIQAQLIAAERSSPLHSLLGHLLPVAAPIGVLIALAELAVGIGTMIGLWTRIAAIGGALLSLTLFLTVSYHTSPYYTGADIVFLFAWSPLILAGGSSAPSLDAAIAARAGAEAGTGPAALVALPFSTGSSSAAHTSTIVAGPAICSRARSGPVRSLNVGVACAAARRPPTLLGPPI